MIERNMCQSNCIGIENGIKCDVHKNYLKCKQHIIVYLVYVSDKKKQKNGNRNYETVIYKITKWNYKFYIIYGTDI